MTPERRANLQRLLKPRHIAVIGGNDAEIAIGECARIGFEGPIWPVNPKRREIGGHPCFRQVDDLPEPPDAVFLAVPREPAIETLGRLRAIGAGGVVCYAAGFGELGGEGTSAEKALIEAAGDLAVIGPNCYGVINYIDRVALWPFVHGSSRFGYGAAIITQSGMLACDLTISQRSTPLAFMISAGNQAILKLEDFIDVLCERDEVRAIGLHIEGLKDIARFEQAVLKAHRRQVPIVALKTGRSTIGAALAVSHTGSLSGADDLYDALFERLGIIRVSTPSALLETLKWITVAGLPKGQRIAGLTCSGGSAAMLADRADEIGLAFSKPSSATVERLRKLLPFTATVSNPLDYTTPIWGMPEKTGPVFETFLADGYDAAVLVQDYAPAGLDESTPFYRNDARAFVDAAARWRVPAAVCSTLPENMDEETREILIRAGVAPMQGLADALDAIAGSAWHAERLAVLFEDTPDPIIRPSIVPGAPSMVDEGAAKALLQDAGLMIPDHRITSAADAPSASERLGYPLVLKMLSPNLPHKTEAGAVRLNLDSAEAVESAIRRMQRDVAAYDEHAVTDRFLLERMAPPPVAELMVGLRLDPQFGVAMTIAGGGVLVELIGDSVTVLLPAPRSTLAAAIDRLKVKHLLDGYRGGPVVDRSVLIDTLERLAAFASAPEHRIVELEINPLFVYPDKVLIIDALIRTACRT